jgi:hypothetical protein
MGISDKGPGKPGEYIVRLDDPEAKTHLVERVPLRALNGATNDVQKSIGDQAMGTIDGEETPGDFSDVMSQILRLKNEPADLHRLFREQKQKHGDAFLRAVCERFSWKSIQPSSAGIPAQKEPDITFYLVPNFTHLQSDLPEIEVIGVRKIGEKAVVRFRRLLSLTTAISALKI